MPLPQHIPINITPENVWAVLDAVESDYEDDLADVMEGSDTEFVVEDEEKEDYQDEGDEENADNSIPETNQTLHTIVHDMNTTDDEEDKVQSRDEVIGNADGDGNKNKKDTIKEIHWTKSTKYIPAQEECKLDGEVPTDIHPLDNPPKVFEKLLNFDEFLQHLKLESER